MKSHLNTGSQSSFSVSQVLRGIEHYLSTHCDKSIQLDPDKSVLAYIDEASSDDCCPLDFLEMLAEYFQLDWDARRWTIWLGLYEKDERNGKRHTYVEYHYWERKIAPHKTVLMLATTIAKRAPGISLEPVTVFGKECGPAGAFYGLCQLPEIQSAQLAPSTPLKTALSAWNYAEFWERLEWIVGKKLPELPNVTLQRLPIHAKLAGMATLGLTLLAAGFVGMFFLQKSCFFLGAVSAVIVLFTGLAFHRKIQYQLVDFFPEDIKTLRDLAHWIDRQHSTHKCEV